MSKDKETQQIKEYFEANCHGCGCVWETWVSKPSKTSEPLPFMLKNCPICVGTPIEITE